MKFWFSLSSKFHQKMKTENSTSGTIASRMFEVLAPAAGRRISNGACSDCRTSDPFEEFTTSDPDVLISVPQPRCISDPDNIHERLHRVIMIPVVVIIIVTNVMILGHSVMTGRFRRPGSWSITSLCVADLLVGLTSSTTIISDEDIDTDLQACLLHIGAVIATILASLLCILTIAVDRFLAITHALTYDKTVTTKRITVVLVCICVLSLLVGFAPITGWNSHYYYKRHCSFAYTLHPSYIVFLLTSAVLPISIVQCVYAYIYFKARSHIKKIDALHALHHGRLSCAGALGWSPRDWRCFRRIAAVTGCVSITWAPFLLTSLLDAKSSHTPCWLKDIIGTHFLMLGLINSILNPLIYSVCTREFWKVFKMHLTRCRCLKRKGNFTLN